jgi:hypothetical protein
VAELIADGKVRAAGLSNHAVDLMNRAKAIAPIGTVQHQYSRKNSYWLTEKGLALIPILVEFANWGVGWAPDVVANPFWVNKVRADRTGLYQTIRNTVMAGGSVFRGDNNVIAQLQGIRRRSDLLTPANTRDRQR